MLKLQCPNHDCKESFAVSRSELASGVSCPHCGQTVKIAKKKSSLQSRQKKNKSAALSSSPFPSTQAAIPQTFAGYKVHEIIGRGGFGLVYRAYDEELEREIALKVPTSAEFTHQDKQRFLREAKATARLRHPSIVPVYNAGEIDDIPFIASAFISGQTLYQTMAEESLSEKEAVRIVLKLAEALHYAHQHGIIHRDVKPQNVMIDNKDQPQLMDFGLARLSDSAEKLTQDGAVMGTPAYMSPEQAGGMAELTEASDQYSLGVVLYELLTGKLPFTGTPELVIYNILNKDPASPREIKKSIPPDLETICLKAMAKASNRRYDSCAEFAADLNRWSNGDPIHARPMTLLEKTARWVGKHPTLIGSTIVGLLVVMFAVFGISALVFRQNQVVDDKNTEITQAYSDLNRKNEELSAINEALNKTGQELTRQNEALSFQTQLAQKNEQEALRLQKLADQNFQEAETQRQKANEQLKRVEKMLYVDQIKRAFSLWRNHEYMNAYELLNTCHSDYRGWEYDFLYARLTKKKTRVCTSRSWRKN